MTLGDPAWPKVNPRFEVGVPVAAAKARPSTATVERVPKPGYGAESSSPRGRDARSGEFSTVVDARRRPATTLVEHVPNPKHGR
jgi:hypothetical protein